MTEPVFERGDGVTLAPVERDDADFLQRAHNDPEIRVPVGLTRPRNRAQVEEYVSESVESDDNVYLLVRVDGDPAGQVVARHLDRPRPELSFWLVPERRGEGHATEAVSLLVDYLFDTFDVLGVYAQAFADNEASRALLERLGFEREGRLRENRFVRGEYRDTVHYGLLRDEWVESDRKRDRGA